MLNRYRYYEFLIDLQQQLAAAHAKIARIHLIYGRVLRSTALAIEHQHYARAYAADARASLFMLLEEQRRDRMRESPPCGRRVT